jgi:hypothetical protein
MNYFNNLYFNKNDGAKVRRVSESGHESEVSKHQGPWNNRNMLQQEAQNTE